MQAGLAQIARHSSSLLLFMVFCVVMGVGAFMIGDLHTATVQVQRMYAGSVQGLRQIGELQYEAQVRGPLARCGSSGNRRHRAVSDRGAHAGRGGNGAAPATGLGGVPEGP